MFEKLVAIEPVSLIPSAEEKLQDYAKEVVLYRDIPADDDEIVRRIGDADAVLLSYTSRIGQNILCAYIRYIARLKKPVQIFRRILPLVTYEFQVYFRIPLFELLFEFRIVPVTGDNRKRLVRCILLCIAAAVQADAYENCRK